MGTEKHRKLAGRVAEKIKESPWLLAAVWSVIYMIGFMAVGRLAQPRYVIHMKIDDWIPFSEWFLIPYCVWFLWMPGMLLYYLFRSRKEYFELVFVMLGGMSLCVIFYMFFPNCLDFRTAVENKNILCRLVNMLYAFDPPTNAFPSIHVGSTVAVFMVTAGSKRMRRKKGLQLLAVVMTILICLSTVMLKQHSVADVISGALLNIFLYIIICRTKKGRAFLARF